MIANTATSILVTVWRYGSVYRKTEPISDILKTDTDTDVGIWKTENTEKPTKKTENNGYFGISEAAVAVLHMHNCTLHNALKNAL